VTGALWEDQVQQTQDLPSKGEEMIAVFWLRERVLMCTNITLIQKTADIYNILVNQWTLMNLNKNY
jgi:hypothetical protein